MPVGDISTATSKANVTLDEWVIGFESALSEGALIGEIEPFAKSTDCSGVFPLPPGEHVAVCNITNTPKGKKPVSHLAKGMLTTFTVTEPLSVSGLVASGQTSLP